jgi:hypothetical protein
MYFACCRLNLNFDKNPQVAWKDNTWYEVKTVAKDAFRDYVYVIVIHICVSVTRMESALHAKHELTQECASYAEALNADPTDWYLI